jgi:hypothetical protein
MGKRTECEDRRRQQRRPRANGPIAHLARRDMRILDFAEQILERNTARQISAYLMMAEQMLSRF